MQGGRRLVNEVWQTSTGSIEDELVLGKPERRWQGCIPIRYQCSLEPRQRGWLLEVEHGNYSATLSTASLHLKNEPLHVVQRRGWKVLPGMVAGQLPAPGFDQ